MTVRECYEAMGADYEDVLGRLRKDERIQKFVLKLLNDKSYELLMNSMEAGDMTEAFRAAHTLKGVAGNLSLSGLYEQAAKISEALRSGDLESAKTIMPDVKAAYKKITEALAQD